MKKQILFLVTLLIGISSVSATDYGWNGTFIWYLIYPDGSKRVNVENWHTTDWVYSYSIRDRITNCVLEDKKNIYNLAPSQTKIDSIIVSWTEIKGDAFFQKFQGFSGSNCYTVKFSRDGKVIISDLERK